MARATAVILVVGLNQSLLRHAPRLTALAQRGRVRRLRPVLPAVTCSVQASMLTGLAPSEHGIVGNGWYHRELAEVHFWKQSNRLVHGEKIWDAARQRDPTFTCANLFWWFNMYSAADVSVTPRPMYTADGRKVPDCYTTPSDLRERLQAELGAFPLFQFWGPGASIASSRWIVDASTLVYRWQRPTLSLVYLPHLDYALQKLGPAHESIPKVVREIDAEVGRLLDYYDDQGVRPMVVSEYGIEPVMEAVKINVVLRRENWLRVREERGHELLDAGASDAFAVADHQVAHVYVRDAALLPRVAEVCGKIDGVASVLDRRAQTAAGLAHERGGDLVLVADAGRWFAYRYWLNDRHAPDFARTVDIHRKPGYDPLELFIDPTIRLPKLRIAAKLLARKLGMRTLMNVIPLDESLVRGSHGRVDIADDLQPILITTDADGARPGSTAVDGDADVLPCQAVRDVIIDHLFPSDGRGTNA